MLKIKDSVDLKELEKFGFINFKWDNTYHNGKFTVLKNRHIRSRAGNPYNGLDDLFDLIKADMVEKVEEL